MIKTKSTSRAIVLFLMPAICIYFIFEVLPVITTFYFSFNFWPGIKSVPLKFVGLKNYFILFEDKAFAKSLTNVLIYVLVNIIGQVGIGYILAFCLFFAKKGLRFYKAAFFIPMIISATATSLLWGFIYFPGERGILNNVLMRIGLGEYTKAWLANPNTALLAVAAVTIWCGIGYYMTIGFAALMSVPEDIIEAAIIDGADIRTRIFKIILPLIWNSVVISIIMVITGVLKVFDVIYVMTPGGGPRGTTHVPATLMYDQAFKFNTYGLGSATATIIFILSIVLTLISFKVLKKEAVEY